MTHDRPVRTRILLARHGEAAYETAGSGDSGGSLTPAGREQAARLGHRVRAFGPTKVVCSELSRAVQTAEIAAAVPILPVEVCMGLQEFDVGDERGRPYNASLFEPLQESWMRGDLSAQIPGGEDGHAVARRMFTVLERLTDECAGCTIVVVSHGGAITSVLGSLSAGDADGIRPCDVYVLERGRDGWQISGRDRDPAV